ncbi:hypothetical protein OCUAc18_16830 [Acinetobacter baumannii]|nr:hypothetical protein OCUAc18_16830 [Acinetobacter baumannii]
MPCLFKKAFIEVSKQYTSIREPFQEYTNWLINLLNSLLVELDIRPLAKVVIASSSDLPVQRLS